MNALFNGRHLENRDIPPDWKKRIISELFAIILIAIVPRADLNVPCARMAPSVLHVRVATEEGGTAVR